MLCFSTHQTNLMDRNEHYDGGLRETSNREDITENTKLTSLLLTFLQHQPTPSPSLKRK